MKPSQQLRLIVTIVERGKGNKVRRLYQEHQVFTHIHCEGVGTATSEILDILGIGSSEKDVLFSLTPQSTARALFRKLSDELHGTMRTRGIAFILPMDAVSNLLSAIILVKTKLEKENGGDDVPQTKNSLILAIINRGTTGAVMETAKKAGARGGPSSRPAGPVTSSWTGPSARRGRRRRSCCSSSPPRSCGGPFWRPSTPSTAPRPRPGLSCAHCPLRIWCILIKAKRGGMAF